MRIISRVINVRVSTKTRNKAPIFAKLEFARLSLSKKEKKKKKKKRERLRFARHLSVL